MHSVLINFTCKDYTKEFSTIVETKISRKALLSSFL